MQAPQKAWTSLWSCSWGFCGLQILHTQDHNQIGSVPFQKHILALHTSATSAAGVSAGVSAFTYRHKPGTVNNLWIICHFHSQIHPESTLICLCTKITRRTWTKHDNFHYCRLIMSEKVPSCSLHMLLCQCIFQWCSRGESTKVR